MRTNTRTGRVGILAAAVTLTATSIAATTPAMADNAPTYTVKETKSPFDEHAGPLSSNTFFFPRTEHLTEQEKTTIAVQPLSSRYLLFTGRLAMLLAPIAWLSSLGR
ncbi:hypothetical protein CGLAU_12050 [Corynebacterium glaucum]|uniref:Uncharacterized protein n=1 Tax=Corynebacterium glaucum TaxID=187491 RepID=A0A1Q2HZR4_9CORY|nr:hypothetical protein [Corynebacterium glaucum]AQQ16338.1 hypothetical protein CGLAU_12050 [Corynebacterium glaucum]